MEKTDSKEEIIIKKEIDIIKKIGSEEAFNNVKVIVRFLKYNKLTIGYTKGSTSSLFVNYKIGLSIINPLEYSLVSERNYLRKPYPSYDLPPHNKPYFGILLDKVSYKKVQQFLKEQGCTDEILEHYNIDISYDKRLDKIKNHKKQTFKQLTKLAVNKSKANELFEITYFNNYVDANSLNKSIGLKDYWIQEQQMLKYHLLSSKYSFLKVNNSLNVILYQEEWMKLIKKITGLSDYKVNLFRKSLSKKMDIKYFKNRLKTRLKEKYQVGKDLHAINDILIKSMDFLPCKAHLVADSYIELIASQ